MENIELLQEDITTLEVDAIVNAANTSLLGGGGVDGAIHRAAGPKLKEACEKLNGCDTGEAKITEGFNLPARYVIHAVGPVWHGGKQNEAELLKSCYFRSLLLASDHKLKTVAFPNISTGVYHFPKDKAAEIAINTVSDFLEKNRLPHKVYFVTFDQENYKVYRKKLFV